MSRQALSASRSAPWYSDLHWGMLVLGLSDTGAGTGTGTSPYWEKYRMLGAQMTIDYPQLDLDTDIELPDHL